MDNSEMVFCKVEDIEKMNEAIEEDKTIEFEENMLESDMDFEYCEYCLGTSFVEIDSEEYDCEYCEIYECSYSSDSDSEYIPDWSEDNDTDEDSYYEESEESDCGEACNENVCFCGSV